MKSVALLISIIWVLTSCAGTPDRNSGENNSKSSSNNEESVEGKSGSDISSFIRSWVRLDSSILNLGYPFKMYAGEAILCDSFDPDLEILEGESEYDFYFTPGPTEISITIFYPDSVNSEGNPVEYLSAVESYDFQEETNSATLSIENERIVLLENISE